MDGKKHVKVQSMTEPLTKFTCKRRSHNQCSRNRNTCKRNLVTQCVVLSSDVIMSYIVDDAIYKV